MKKLTQVLFITMFVTLLIGPTSLYVTAHESEDTPTSSETEQKVLEDTKAADYQAKLKERLAKNIEIAKTNLTQFQQSRIKLRCKSAQGKVTSVNANIKTFRANRAEVYDKIATRLGALSTKLKAAGVDTTELDKQIAELHTLVDKFKTDVTELNQAAADLANMDCTTDPDGFKAALEALRLERKSVAEDSAAIRAYIVDTIKPTLQAIKQSVDKQDTTEGN